MEKYIGWVICGCVACIVFGPGIYRLWAWREVRFIEKKLGHKIIINKTNPAHAQRCLIDIGIRGSKHRISWYTAREIRKVRLDSKFQIVRLATFKTKVKRHLQDATSIDYFMIGADFLEYQSVSEKWAFESRYCVEHKHMYFRLGHSQNRCMKINAPAGSEQHYLCDKELFQILGIVENFHSLREYAYANLVDQCIPLLEESKNNCKSPEIAAVRKALQAGTTFFADDYDRKIEVTRTVEKKKPAVKLLNA